MNKTTKESLIIELAKLKQTHADLVSDEEYKRKEFAKAFNWYDEKPSYGYSSKERYLVLPSWEQIFVKIGKLLVAKDFYDYEGNLSELECKLEDLEKRLLKNVNPNL